MRGELAAILLVVAVHLFGLAVLLWAMLDGDRVDLRGWWPRDEDPEAPPQPPAPAGSDLPPPSGAPARVRLRGPAPLPRTPARARRGGDHAPHPARPRQPR